jgi:hypothetical protein
MQNTDFGGIGPLNTHGVNISIEITQALFLKNQNL